MEVTFFETQFYFSSPQTPPQRQYNGDEEFSMPLLVPSTSADIDLKTDSIDVEVQEANNELSSIDDKPNETPVKELRVYSRR